MRTNLAVVAAVAAMLLAGPVWAAHLEKVDEKVDKQIPQQDQESPTQTCLATAAGTANIYVVDDSVSVETTTRAFVSSSTDECHQTINATITILVTLTLVPDGGEQPGDPVTLCLRENHDVFGATTGEAQAIGSLGSASSLLDPETVTRDPGAVTLLSTGPFNVQNSREVDGSARLVTADIGDLITMSIGTQSLAKVDDVVGTGNASTAARLALNIGQCPREEAPAASPVGLVALALGLAALGAFGVRRQMARRRI